ncbi:unnamed protein product, partial [Citrullus colocynthis]
ICKTHSHSTLDLLYPFCIRFVVPDVPLHAHTYSIQFDTYSNLDDGLCNLDDAEGEA